MACDVECVIRPENVNLVCPFVSAFAQVAPAGYTEFAGKFIACPDKIRRCGVNRFQTPDGNQNIDNRLGCKSGNRRASDVPDSQCS